MVFAVRLKPLYCTNTTTPATAQDLAPLLDRKGEGEGGTLDASPAIRSSDNEEKGTLLCQLPRELCARVVTRHAAGLLQACGVERLVLSSNPCLETLPLQALCDVASLTELMCTGCPSLFAPPMEVAEQGGNETMKFLRDCSQDGVFNESLGLFLIGDGEAGKTSVLQALMNEAGNVAGHIGKDTRTVGMDMKDWETKDGHGHPLILKSADAGGQQVYEKGHELFVVDRAVYLYLWRADADFEQVREAVVRWLNLLQSCVPGVAVLPVVTHIDCVSPPETLERARNTVQKVFKDWVQSQQNLQAKSPSSLVVRIIDDGMSMPVNCLTGEGVKELRTRVLEVAETTRGFREPLPRALVELREKVRELGRKEPFISWKKYLEIAQTECGIAEDRVWLYTSFLHETLELRYFGLAATRHRKENFEDFLTAVLGKDSNRDVRALFDSIDTDKSGAIDKKELTAFAREHGLSHANIDLMMESADDDGSGTIDFDEFRRRFEHAQAAAGNVLIDTVYVSVEWMVDVIKGLVRHDHGALREFAREYATGSNDFLLEHQVRRMRVQGVIDNNVISDDYLWPGSQKSKYWAKVQSDDTENFKYERGLWRDLHGGEGLKKVVDSEEARRVAVGLLEGFKIVLPIRADRSQFYCPDLVPPHARGTIDSWALDDVKCPYWMRHIFAALPGGFWTAIFMEIRSVTTSGSNSASVQTFFLLSAKIQIKRSNDGDGNVQIDMRASTRKAFDVAVSASVKIAKFYRGMELWRVATETISAEDSAKIIEPAQVLVLTAAPLVLHKSEETIAAFNQALSKWEADLRVVKKFIQDHRTRAVIREQVETDTFERMQANLEAVEALRVRLNTPGGDHYTGSKSLDDISKDLDNFFESQIRPNYWRLVRCWQTQSSVELDKALFRALKKGDTNEAKKLLLKGADSPYERISCCWCFNQSSVHEANQSEDLQDLLHSFGCDAKWPGLKKPAKTRLREEAGERLKNTLDQLLHQQPFSQPRSLLPFAPSEDALTPSAQWIMALYHVLEEEEFATFHISKEVFSPHNKFVGNAQVVIVLLDENISRSELVCERFRELEKQGCAIIGVIMPGYPKIEDYSKWWPNELPEFKNHSLFFDSSRFFDISKGCPRQLEVEMRKTLMPQLRLFLEEWTDKRNIGATETSTSGGTKEKSPPGPLTAENVTTYRSKDEMRKSTLPCPRCLELGKENPGAFNRDKCMLHYLDKKDSGANTAGTIYCNTCNEKVTIKQILKRPIFISYNWGKDCSTQKIAIPLVWDLLNQVDMPSWLDVDGGMGYGEELVTAMREGVAECNIVICMISDAFCNSGNCIREFIHTANHSKYMIPLLVPDRGETRTGPSGWTGEYTPGDKDWWKHAQNICTAKDPDNPGNEIPWSYLASFTPVDLRGEKYGDDGSLDKNSPAEKEILQRVMSRFFRGS